MAQFGKTWQGKIAAGRFVLHKHLGSGDRHAVFMTQLRGRIDAKAVIKLVSASSCDTESQLARWRRATTLSHPHLIRVFESGRCWIGNEELLYVVMEYADENLGQVVPQRVLTPQEAEAMLRPMADALSYLHKQGVVHGHIRPSNVLAVDDQLKISSDGIAEAATAVPDSSGVYSPPEAALGKLVPASDVWSLGMLLLHALKGRVAEPKERAKQISELPQPFADIVRGCLRENPSARLSLDDALSRIQPAPPPITEPSEVVQPRRNIPPRLIVGLAAVALLIVVIGIKLLQRPSSSEEHSTPTPSAAASAVAIPSKADQDSAANAATPVKRSQTSAATPSAPQTILDRVMPKPAESALQTIRGTIRIRVALEVDGAGNVSNATFIEQGPSNYFARLAMEAAKAWKFTPQPSQGNAIASEWTLQFQFTQEGVRVIPEQANPSR
jgi:TonB family protein